MTFRQFLGYVAGHCSPAETGRLIAIIFSLGLVTGAALASFGAF